MNVEPKISWRLPCASSSMGRGPTLRERDGRAVAIEFDVDDECADVAAIVFEGVEQFSCTYLFALEPHMLKAYDKLVDWGESELLGKIRALIERRGEPADGLRHLMIRFDDGPCYEAICRTFRIETR